MDKEMVMGNGLVKTNLTDEDLYLDYEYQVNPLFSKHTTMFIGPPQGAKSLTAIYLSVCTAGYKDFLGYVTRPGHVVYLCNEHGADELLDRWIPKLCLGMNINPSDLPITSFRYKYKDFTSTPQSKELLSRCTGSGTVLIVVDNLGSSIGNENENYTHVMQRVFDNFLMFNDAGIAVLPIHHPNTAGKTRGSTVIDAMADSIYTFERVKTRPRASILPNGTPHVEEVIEYYAIRNPKKTTGGHSSPFLVHVLENDETGTAKIMNAGSYVPSSPHKELKELITWVFSLNSGEGLSDKDIQERIGGGELKDIREAVKELREEGKLEFKETGKRVRVFQVGAKNISPPKSTQEKIEDEVDALIENYRKDGIITIYVNQHFCQPFIKKYPELMDESGEKGLVLNGLAQRISKYLKKKYNLEIILGGPGAHGLL